MTRQRLRKGLLLVSFLLFPITMNYFSPYVIIDGASQGVVNGSLVVFSMLFLSALFLGRAWCGWLCPAGALGEMCFSANDRAVNSKKIDWIKWAIWIPWIGIILWMVISAGGYHKVDPLMDTVGGISVAGDADRPVIAAYAIYYIVIGLFVALSLGVGRRAGCHSVCWMAPFMIGGRKLSNAAHLPALRLTANPSACKNCQKCTSHCPMSLDVNQMVKRSSMETSECIVCGTCVDNCPQGVIHYTFSRG